jgi:phage terminase large subunit
VFVLVGITPFVAVHFSLQHVREPSEVSGVGVEIDKTPAFFDQISGDWQDPLHPRKWPITADSARPETISYMMRNGYPQIERARKGPGSVEEGIEFLKSYDIVVNPNCTRVIDELTNYSYEIDPHTEEVLPKLADEDNHTIDALRYAIEPIRRSEIPHPRTKGQCRESDFGAATCASWIILSGSILI